MIQDKEAPSRTLKVEDKKEEQEKDKERERERDKEKDKENEPENNGKTIETVPPVSEPQVPPPRASLTPRISDMAQTDSMLQLEADKENERQTTMETNIEQDATKTTVSDDGLKDNESEVSTGLYIVCPLTMYVFSRISMSNF